MNAIAPVSGFLTRYENSRAHLPGHEAARHNAAKLLTAQGLPVPRDEAWKYTNLRSLNGMVFADTAAAVDLPPLGAFADYPRLVFACGKFCETQSRLPKGVTLTRLADAAVAEPADNDQIAALNMLLAEDGIFIDVPAGHDAGTLLLISLGAHADAQTTNFHPRHGITLGNNARLQLIEIFVGAATYVNNPRLTVSLADHARLDHVRVQADSKTSFYLARIEADIAANASYDLFCLNLGARLARTEVFATLAGANAHASVNAAQKLGGIQHGDFTSVIRHRAPNTRSRQTVKNVLDDESRAVFQGRIEVARIAQKTDGYQMNQTLLLSPRAEIDCKPELEIFADDVKCSHGATVGALNDEHIFYLRSRGIGIDQARAMLTDAFLQESLNDVADEAVRNWLIEILSCGDY